MPEVIDNETGLDFKKIRAAMHEIYSGEDDEAVGKALEWVFHSTDLQPDGFPVVAQNAGIHVENFRRQVLDRSAKAREFVYGKRSPDDAA